MWTVRIGRFLGFIWLMTAIAVPPGYSQLKESLDAVFKSALRRAIDRGLRPEGDLAKELEDLENYTVSTQRDATAICELLKRLPLPPNQRATVASESVENYAAQLFQSVEHADCAAFPILRERGIPELLRIFDAVGQMQRETAKDDQLAMLKVFALYGTTSGTEKVIEAVRIPLQPEDWMWYPILGTYDAEHPQLEKLYTALSEPLPPPQIDAALLDAANSIALDGSSIRHPFDTPAGRQRLRDWLADRDSDAANHAFAAAVAVAFLSGPEREELLTHALGHPDPEVQMEAAWAAARLGQDRGLQALAAFCLDLHCSERARRYLVELDREDRIPPEARNPEFAARAEFASWLAHPNELARRPDEVTVVDQRELVWPPDGQRHQFFLLKFLARRTHELDEDDAGVGLVGSITFCFFDDDLLNLPPDDVYATHCFWEAENAEQVTRISKPTDADMQDWLSQWQGNPLSDIQFVRAYRIATQLNYPQPTVAIATAKSGDESGFAVFDGPRSHWYPVSEFPAGMFLPTVLEIHLGRQLLGFHDTPDRRKFFLPPPSPLEPAQVVAAYTKLLLEAETGDLRRRQELLTQFDSPLKSHFKKYTAAVAATGNNSQDEAVIQAADRLLAAIQALPDKVRSDALKEFISFEPFLEGYFDALIATKQPHRVAETITTFEPYNKERDLDLELGMAAFKANLNEKAEQYLRAFLAGINQPFLMSQQCMLAETVHRLGKVDEARALLLDSLKSCRDAYPKTENGDRETCEESYQNHRATFLRLFASDGPEMLRQERLPVRLSDDEL